MNVYRLYSPQTDEHLYTSDFHEAMTITAERGWQYEGIGFTASSSEGQPVWRLYNTATNLHLWTTDANERAHWLAAGGWNDEGVAWYGAGPYRMARLYNPNTGQHLYTRDANEVKVLSTQRGWTNEAGAGTWSTGDATDYVPIKGTWVTSSSWGKKDARYWVRPNGNIAKSCVIPASDGAGFDHDVYATSDGSILKNDLATINGVVTAADGEGGLYPIPQAFQLDVPYINQDDEGAPTGCEGASLYMALRAKGYIQGMTFRQFMETMPYATDGNPYHGFVGSPYEVTGQLDAMLMDPVASWGARYGKTENITGCSENRLISELAQGNPVVAWVSFNFVPIHEVDEWYGKRASNWHVVTLMGYDPSADSFMVSDPASKKHQYWVSRSAFDPVWEVQRGAVVVR